MTDHFGSQEIPLIFYCNDLIFEIYGRNKKLLQTNLDLFFFFNSLLYVDGLYVAIMIFLCVHYINKNRLNETGLPYYSFFSILQVTIF